METAAFLKFSCSIPIRSRKKKTDRKRLADADMMLGSRSTRTRYRPWITAIFLEPDE